MGHKVTVPFLSQNGVQELKEGEYMDIREREELWSEYKLDDGNTVSIKIVVSEIIKLDEKIGDKPNYALKTSTTVSVKLKE